MVDHVTKAHRSLIMGRIGGKDTAPELLVRSAAHRLGLRFRLHGRHLPGRPDLILPKWRTVIFVNGCFWHGHPGCKKATIPKTNRKFWLQKIHENTRRDDTNYARLSAAGWRVVVLWQCEVKTTELATTALRALFPQPSGARS